MADNDDLGDCRKIRYRIAPNFCLASRRDNSYISRYAPAGATPKPGKKTSKMVFSLTEIALSLYPVDTQHSANSPDTTHDSS